MKDLPASPDIDHNHKTNQVRGLLCRTCNLVLGLVKEDKSRLTRLRLYLDRDPSKQSIYIIGSLRHPDIPSISNKLREEGYDVWDEWVAAGPNADDHWRDYEKRKGHNFPEALQGKAAENVFYFDKALIDLADIGILVMPAGKSAHLELGYMSAQGKPVYILLDAPPERFDVMPQFAAGVSESLETIIGWLKKEMA